MSAHTCQLLASLRKLRLRVLGNGRGEQALWRALALSEANITVTDARLLSCGCGAGRHHLSLSAIRASMQGLPSAL